MPTVKNHRDSLMIQFLVDVQCDILEPSLPVQRRLWNVSVEPAATIRILPDSLEDASVSKLSEAACLQRGACPR